MARIGHSSTRAAMIYQHATRDRDDAIAAALDTLIEDERQDQRGSGTGWGGCTTPRTSNALDPRQQP